MNDDFQRVGELMQQAMDRFCADAAKALQPLADSMTAWALKFQQDEKLMHDLRIMMEADKSKHGD